LRSLLGGSEIVMGLPHRPRSARVVELRRVAADLGGGQVQHLVERSWPRRLSRRLPRIRRNDQGPGSGLPDTTGAGATSG
jgi:hypothetical protein